jgi:protein-disulfide isomerase
MRFVFRNFPLTEIHPAALHAAEAAESVAARVGAGAYWVMHELLFAHQRDSELALDDAHLVLYAQAAGADAESVAQDLGAGTFEQRVVSDLTGGVASGLHGTPSFFVNGEQFLGDWSDLSAFGTALEEAATGERDTDEALEIELAREAAEGADLIGDTKLNRNVSGSSTWETLPDDTTRPPS